MKKVFTYIAILLVFLCCNACATQQLWKITNPNQYVKIRYADISERELKNKKLSYIKNDTFKYFLVEMDSFAKLKNYTLRFLGTPVTLAFDTATVVVVAIGLAVADDNCKKDPNCNSFSDYWEDDYWERER